MLRCTSPLVATAALRSRLCGAAHRTMLRIAGNTLHRIRDTNQSTLKIASASTACARKPTVKASVRNTGSPIE
jgi:hypothetical protein